jgi:hypothetical protein
MRTTRIGLLALTTAAIVGCGGGSHFANKPKPAIPVNITVYVNNARVSVSPSSVGAGPVVFIVTNQANTAQSVQVLPAGQTGAQALAATGPINPQGTAQVTVNLTSPGAYTIGTAMGGSSDATIASPTSIQPALLRVGPPRPNGSNALLQP